MEGSGSRLSVTLTIVETPEGAEWEARAMEGPAAGAVGPVPIPAVQQKKSGSGFKLSRSQVCLNSAVVVADRAIVMAIWTSRQEGYSVDAVGAPTTLHVTAEVLTGAQAPRWCLPSLCWLSVQSG